MLTYKQFIKENVDRYGNYSAIIYRDVLYHMNGDDHIDIVLKLKHKFNLPYSIVDELIIDQANVKSFNFVYYNVEKKEYYELKDILCKKPKKPKKVVVLPQ